MTVAIIVQARMESRRFPGKVMKMLGGKTVVGHVLDRALSVSSAAFVGLAIPDTPVNHPLRIVAKRRDIPVYPGAHHNVFTRYLHAVRHFEKLIGQPIETVVRITADCPLTDPQTCNGVIEALHRSGADYASNCWPRTFPFGLDVEAFSVDALERANSLLANTAEHVTTLFTPDATFRRTNVETDLPGLTRHRWLVDYPADLDFLNAVFKVAEPQNLTGMLEILERNPVLARRSVLPAPHR